MTNESINFHKEITKRILKMNEQILKSNLKLLEIITAPRIEIRSNPDLSILDNYPGKDYKKKEKQ